jgi:2-methylcitrate dehydratase PrpD
VKHAPPTPYAAKFSTPYCMAVGFFDRRAGLGQFTETRVQDPAVLALCRKIRFVINPLDEYPRSFTGHLRARLTDGSTREHRQPHMRGGAHAPMPQTELERKFLDNALHGGWDTATAQQFMTFASEVFHAPALGGLQTFRR